MERAESYRSKNISAEKRAVKSLSCFLSVRIEKEYASQDDNLMYGIFGGLSKE